MIQSENVEVILKGPIKNTGKFSILKEKDLAQVIYGQGGGFINPKHSFKALLWGGSFGALLSKNELKKSINDLKKDLSLDNVGFVFSDLSCMVNLVHILTLYNFQKLSICKKCDFCETTLKEAGEILERVISGKGKSNDLEILRDLVKKRNEAKCLRGENSLLPLKTSLENFSEEFKEHVERKYCRASVCEDMFISPCVNSCPAGVDLPGTIGLMQKGMYQEAVDLGREKNPFLLSCGRICEEPPCQKFCQRQKIDESINSPCLHRYAGEMAKGEKSSLKPHMSTGKKVAIVGAGPAGLSAAYYLTLYGHEVHAFEKNSVYGGMMRLGIPKYRLPRDILDEEVENILNLGVNIHYNQSIGKDFFIKDLQDAYDGVYLAIGAHGHKAMGIKGEELIGVLPGIEFLAKVNLGEKVEIGSKVVVVGGGNVAIDAARCALRLGAKEVKIVYRRSKEDMPASEKEIKDAIEEGIEIIPLTNPSEFKGEERVQEVILRKMDQGEFDPSGRRRVKNTDELYSIPVDHVILAVGQRIESEIFKDSGLELKGDQIKVDYIFKTSLEGVFAGGDCVTGPFTAVNAIGQGRKAAKAIHNYLLGGEQLDFVSKRSLLRGYVGPYTCEPLPQQKPDHLELEERITGFASVEKVYTEENAQIEMKRCICAAKTGL